eukprot:GDKI01032478.1.p1 GENE.GDKI01032478.1~~GDKI01032478.1.p1  ORF type:complete len:848 (-),score=288.72 GDKI01032478.1:159-2702(-)
MLPGKGKKEEQNPQQPGQPGVPGEDTQGKENEEDSVAQEVEAFFDGKFMTILMTILTFFALFGDDVRLAAFYKAADPYFFSLFIVAFALFLTEIIAFSIIKEDYKWSFFFFLDFVATFSLLPDIKWIVEPLQGLMFMETTTSSASGSLAKAGRIVRLVRLIRLIRVVKLYKYCSKASDEDEEEKLREQARNAQNAKQAALKRVEASRLGKYLSEMTTRKVIVGVLLMLLVIPVLQVSEEDNSRYFGLRQLFWYGRSQCKPNDANDNRLYCNVQTQNWVTEEGWQRLLQMYVEVSKSGDTGQLTAPLLWLRVPDYRNKGMMRDISAINVTSTKGVSYTWEADPSCTGESPSNCQWRDSELDNVVYKPPDCKGTACRELTAYARFQTRANSKDESIYSIAQTVFIMVLLGTLAMLFSQDTQTLVIAPIEKMVNIIKQLADDPLSKPTVSKPKEDPNDVKKRKKKQGPQLETSVLENTILKIGGLLQVGFGEAGAEIIGNNMSSGDGELNIMIPGKKITAIFGFIDIRRFTDATEALQEDVMVFVNLVGTISHTCAHVWNGAANKNVGDAFLFTWKIGYANEVLTTTKETTRQLYAAELANKALVSFVKCIVEVRRSPQVHTFEEDERMRERFGPDYLLRIGYGMHVGWAIEGALGSDYKIDASYLSPHVTFTEKLQEATKIYRTPLLMSEPFYCMLSLKAKERVRKVDVILPHFGVNEPIGLYSFDIEEKEVPLPPGHEVRKMGEIVKPEDIDELPIEHLSGAGVEYMFVMDNDIVCVQKGIPDELFTVYRSALCSYCDGDWQAAEKGFKKTLELRPHDGPAQALLEFLDEHEGKAPEGWQGYRQLPVL